ncbi:hypothetical protein [Streptomyces sp. EN16]|uniref:hypothetical protein n=1 Tax=Streptomyces sp. EN16 TaxID=212773 RepID=UPI000851AC26|nr:hypothetical protein [Streptomyces sp. EN16]
MTIKPIETRYASHRFRSRLEARWAVFFDTLGLRWEYEPQGYLVGPERKPYLPDFWLPKERLWVEVKGSEEHLDVELLVHAASLDTGLPRTTEPHVVSEHEARLLVLGPHGRGVHGLIDKASKEHVGYVLPIHTALTIRKGDVFQSHAWFSQNGVTVDPTEDRIADDSVDIDWEGRGHRWGNLVGGGGMISEDKYDETVVNAYQSAISARFEHGQSGA